MPWPSPSVRYPHLTLKGDKIYFLQANLFSNEKGRLYLSKMYNRSLSDEPKTDMDEMEGMGSDEELIEGPADEEEII